MSRALALTYPDNGKGADISECGQYRYRLWRWWDTSLDLLGFIMLNPSTADADTNDATICKCMGFARHLSQQADLGFGGIMVTNLFAFRATRPADMKAAQDPIGPDNEVFLRTEAATCRMTICAWGNHGSYLGRSSEVLQYLRSTGASEGLRALSFTKNGEPRHPLYIPYSVKPVRFPGLQPERGES